MLVGAHPSITPGVEVSDRWHRRAVVVEELLWSVAAQPALQHRPVVVVAASVGEGNLVRPPRPFDRSEEHTSELQSLMRISYAVFCLKKKKKDSNYRPTHIHTS